MAEPLHLVTGATGNVGRAVARTLLANGARVRCAGRSRPPGGKTGWARLDFEDPASFAAALDGADRLFLMRPPPLFRVGKTLNRFLDAAVKAGVQSCVFLSVAGAERSRMVPHRAVEDRLRQLPIRWTILRPGFFAQNFTDTYRPDILRGELVLPAGDAKVAFVDTRDLGAAAASVMLAPEAHAGRAYELTGPASHSFEEAMEMLGALLGRPLRYRAVSPAAYFLRRLRARSTFPHAAILTAIHGGLRDGSGARITPDLGRLIGREPCDLYDFFRDHLAQFQPAARH